MTSFQMVGTAPATVGRSFSIMSTSDLASRWQSGSTRSAPAISAAYGRPQALAWNIGTIGMHAIAGADPEAVAGTVRHRVQVARTMAVDDAFGVAGGAAGVAHCGRGVLVDVRPVEFVRLAGHDVGVAQHGLARFFQRGDVAVADRDHGVHRLEVGEYRRQHVGQRQIDQHHLVFGLVGDVHDLLGEQPDVEGMQHRAHRRHRQIRRQVFGVVPHEGGDPLVAGDTDAPQRIRQLRGVLTDLGVGVLAITVAGGRGDFARSVHAGGVPQNGGDRQGKAVHGAVHRWTASGSA